MTRAGPSLRVLDVQRKNAPATVYNFSVEDYQTYFVGNSKLWVHNTSSGLPPRVSLYREVKVTYTPPHPEAGTTATDFDNIDWDGNSFWFVQDKLNSSGNANTVQGQIRSSLSKQEKAILAAKAGQLEGLPSNIHLNTAEMYGDVTQIKFGVRVGHPNPDDAFQREVIRQVTDWEVKHQIAVYIEFIKTS